MAATAFACRGMLTAPARTLTTVPRAAVAVTVIRVRKSTDEHEFLLAKRLKPPRVGTWSIPGGKIELGEPTLAAAARELSEETHLRVCDGIRFYPWSIASSDVIIRNNDGTVQFHYVISQMLAFAPAEVYVQAGDDASAVRWATVREVEDGTFELGGNVGAIFRRADHLVRTGSVLPNDAIAVDGSDAALSYLVER